MGNTNEKWWHCVDCGEQGATVKCAHGPRCADCLRAHAQVDLDCWLALSRAHYVFYQFYKTMAARAAEVFPVELMAFETGQQMAELIEDAYRLVYDQLGRPRGESDEDFFEWLRDGRDLPTELLM